MGKKEMLYIDKHGIVIEIRKIQQCDEPRLRKFYLGLSDETLRTYYQGSMRREFIVSNSKIHEECNRDEKDLSLVALYNEDIVGFGVLLRLRTKEKRYEIAFLVSEKFQRNNIGSKLMNLLIENARETKNKSTIVAYTSAINYPVHSFLKKYGFFKEQTDFDQIVWTLEI